MGRPQHIRFSVPEPCTVPWEGMQPLAEGERHCASCEKVIIDFSKMSDDELVLYFKHSKGKTCGRFAQHQLDRPLVAISQYRTKATWWRIALLLPLALFSKSARAQYYEVRHAGQKPDTAALAETKTAFVPADEKEVQDSSALAKEDTGAVAKQDSSFCDTDPAENKNPSKPAPRLVYKEEEISIQIMGDITTTVGICSSPEIPPDWYPGSLGETRTKGKTSLGRPDARKDLADKAPEKPKEPQPAQLPPDELAGILPEPRKGIKRA